MTPLEFDKLSEDWANGLLAGDPFQTFIPELQRFYQATWDVYRILGYDTDGDTEPWACSTGWDFPKMLVEMAEEAMKDMDELEARR